MHVAPAAVSMASWAPRPTADGFDLPPIAFDPKQRNWRERAADMSDYGRKSALYQRYLAYFVGEKTERLDKRPQFVPISLVPRWDNELSDEAIQICAPRSFGGTFDERCLGWIPHHWIGLWHKSGIPDLARYASHEVAAWALWRPSQEVENEYDSEVGGYWMPESLTLALPCDIERLGGAVRAFKATLGNPAPLETITLPRHHFTTEILPLARRFTLKPPITRRLNAETAAATATSPRQVVVKNDEGEALGAWRDGYLAMADERIREAVADHLLNLGIRVAGGTGKPLNLTGDWGIGCLDVFAPRGESEPYYQYLQPGNRGRVLCARVNLRDRVAWVQDTRFEKVVADYLARMGLRAAEICQAAFPWRLSESTAPGEVIPTEVSAAHLPTADGLYVLRDKARLLPDNVRRALPLAYWTDENIPLCADPHRTTYARLEPERVQFFADASLIDASASCRLCALPTVPFTTAISTETLAYCQACLTRAANGVPGLAREVAASALAEIGLLEFEGQPMLETQLEAIHIDPTKAEDGEAIDALLLARMAIRRGQHAWTLLLVDAGLADDGVRMARGTVLPARDGHVCFSLREKMVDDFLHMHAIAHDREPLYPYDPVDNPRTKLRADWRLGDGTLIELWGLPDEPTYAAKMKKKEALAQRKGVRLVGILEFDLHNLPKVFEEWLPEGAPTWRFSPQLLRTPARAPTAKPAAERSAAQIASAILTNSESRRRRLEIAAEAVALREQGLTRAQIAEHLAISPGSLKILLRDGIFYSNPHANWERLERARAARRAQLQGHTKAQYRVRFGLTESKAIEGWRDAGSLPDSLLS